MIEIISSQFAAFWSNLVDLVEITVRLPRALFGSRGHSSLVRSVLLLLFQIVWFPIHAIGWMILALLRFLTDFSAERRREFIYGIPVIVVLGFIGFVVIYVNVYAQAITTQYREKGEALMSAQNFDVAKTYFGRVISVDPRQIQDSDLYNWAIILAQTGEPTRAAAILEKLAPFEKVGYHRAHRLRAISIAQSLGQSDDPLVLKKLRWHLENSRDQSAEVCQSWAVYYVALEQPGNALSWLQKAAEENPANLIDLARIYRQQGNQAAEQRTVFLAEEKFRQLVEKDPLNAGNRISLANVLVQLKKLDDAEAVLLTGIKIQADPVLLRATADYYVMRHDLARREHADFKKQFEFLRTAMNLDVNYPLIYQRFVDLCQDNDNTEELSEIKTAIMNTLTGDQPSALAHFALSNVLWLEGENEQAEWHLEQAYNLEPDFVVVLNNLAWTLANKPEPELDRALALATKVIERAPDDGRFRDTYATVLMKQKKYRQAMAEFEKALLTITNKKPVHEKLAFLYEQLGQHELANLHAQQAGDFQ